MLLSEREAMLKLFLLFLSTCVLCITVEAQSKYFNTYCYPKQNKFTSIWPNVKIDIQKHVRVYETNSLADT